MNREYEIKAKVSETNLGDCIEVTACADCGGAVSTVAYQDLGGECMMAVYSGRINTEDPGVGPDEEYADRAEALGSEWAEIFKTVFAVADSL